MRPDARRRRVHLGRRPTPARRCRSPGYYRCTVCRDQRGGTEIRQAPLDADDLVRSRRTSAPTRSGRCSRPVPGRRRRRRPRRRAARPAHAAPARRPRGDPRADREATCGPRPVLAALRLALLHAILPASRLHGARAGPRDAADRGRPREAARPPSSGASATRGSRSRTRSGWSAGSSSGSTAAPRPGPGPARRGPAQPGGGDRDGGPRPVEPVRRSGPSRPTAGSRDGRGAPTAADPPGPRPAAAPTRPRAARPPRTTRRAGSSAARRRRCCPSSAGRRVAARRRGAGRRAAIGRALEAVEPAMARDGRAVQLVDGGPEAVAAAASAARRRLPALSALARRPDEETAWRRRAAAARARGCRPAADPGERAARADPGGAGDPDVVPAGGCSRPRSGSTSGRSPRPRPPGP